MHGCAAVAEGALRKAVRGPSSFIPINVFPCGAPHGACKDQIEVEGRKENDGGEEAGAPRKAGEGRQRECEGAGGEEAASDRALLLADTERLENRDHAGGMRASLHPDPGEHFQRGPIQARIPEDFAEQPYARARPANSIRQRSAPAPRSING
jgi:hypothetical protein